MEVPAGGDDVDEASYDKAKASRFTFKSSSGRRSKRPRSPHDDASAHTRRESRHKRRHKHSGSGSDRHRTSTRDGAYYDPNTRNRESVFDSLDDNNAASPGLAPEDAFRESLFDALADDEGAAYWEGVYGQPVHVYPDTKPGPDGKLERMTEDEYADYVRTKMWEKSHQHILEEREAKEKARQERKRQRHQREEDFVREEHDRDHIRRQMEESLKRGAERKKAKEAAAAWMRYDASWAELKSLQGTAREGSSKVQELIPWPVLSGLGKHVSKDEIEHFLRASPSWTNDRAALLKVERVRWHPDKMQQRFVHHMDSETMSLVTAVFQVIDRLWNDTR